MLTFGLVLAALWLIPISLVLFFGAFVPMKQWSAEKNVVVGVLFIAAAATTAAGAACTIAAAFAIN